MSNKDLLNDVLASSPNRRSLLKKFGMASAAATAALATGGLKLEADPSAPTVVDVLQFALNLEYLEAEFYTYATTGAGIDQTQYNVGITGSGNQGLTTGGKQVNFGNNTFFTGSVALEIGEDERAHVTLLRGALQAAGIMPVAKPEINLDALSGLGIHAFANEAGFLTLARIFEDIGVTAYGGAAQLPQVGNSPYIGTAARILATEAEHVGNIRLQIAKLSIHTPKLDGVDIQPPPDSNSFISADKTTGLTAIRTPGQVLYLAYGFAPNGATSGGFFPMGVNGNIHTSTGSA
ncbi:MAG: ferritin-like domain-containing protein [Acidobacteriota bacterium]|nr:ferritin-like domain-containing protein [Acidobacteriota bacterium]